MKDERSEDLLLDFCMSLMRKRVLYNTTGPYSDSKEAYLHMASNPATSRILENKIRNRRDSHFYCDVTHHYFLAGA